MKVELQQKLYEKYPKIFRQKDLPMTETCMCWGIDTGDGWYWLLDNLCDALQRHSDSRNEMEKTKEMDKLVEEEEWQVEAVQVKEKFGGLRFYIRGGDDVVFGMIDFAEYLSYRICEECGATEDIKQTRGWIKTLCPKCMTKLNKTPEEPEMTTNEDGLNEG